MPERLSEIGQLPVVTKAELMSHFDDWVTDPSVTRAQIEAFLADPGNVGRDFLGRYVVCTTSGATGIPAILLHDHTALVVYNVLGYARSLPAVFLSCSHCERRAGTGVFASRRSGTSHSAATDTGGSRWTR